MEEQRLTELAEVAEQAVTARALILGLLPELFIRSLLVVGAERQPMVLPLYLAQYQLLAVAKVDLLPQRVVLVVVLFTAGTEQAQREQQEKEIVVEAVTTVVSLVAHSLVVEVAAHQHLALMEMLQRVAMVVLEQRLQ